MGLTICQRCKRLWTTAVEHEFCRGEPRQVIAIKPAVFKKEYEVPFGGAPPHHTGKEPMPVQKPITHEMAPPLAKVPVYYKLGDSERGIVDKDGLIDDSYSANARKLMEN